MLQLLRPRLEALDLESWRAACAAMQDASLAVYRGLKPVLSLRPLTESPRGNPAFFSWARMRHGGSALPQTEGHAMRDGLPGAPSVTPQVAPLCMPSLNAPLFVIYMASGG